MYQNSINPQVLMFGWELPPHNTGGLGVACYGLTKGLASQGVDISFALPRRLKSNVPFMKLLEHRLQGVNVTAFNSLIKGYMTASQYTKTVSNAYKHHLKNYADDLYSEALRYGQMASAWSRHTPHQIIHAHDWMTYPAAMAAKRVSGRPWVAHIHATEYDRTGGHVNSQIADLEYQGLNSADRVIAVSDYTKQIVNRYYAVPSHKIHVVHNGIDLSEFTPQQIREIFPDQNIVLFVGRLTLQKGIDHFLNAAKIVLEKNPDTIFLIVGSGDMHHQLMFQATGLGIGHKVIFTGFLSGTQLQACYQMADAFVMPSVSEPYGIVALEAIASGTPVIVTKQSGVAESLNHILKVDFWDTHKMAELILTVLEYPHLAQQMASQARKEAEHITWDKAAQKTIALYKQLI